MRGLRVPWDCCALNKLFVALISIGRANDSKKHGNVSGLGSALISVTVSAMLAGAFETPAGATQAGLCGRAAGGGGVVSAGGADGADGS